MGPRNDTQFLDCSAISALVNHCCGFTCVAISALVLSFVSIFFSLWIRVIFMCCYLVVHLALRGEARAAIGCKYPQISWVWSFCAMLLWRESSPSSLDTAALSEVCPSVLAAIRGSAGHYAATRRAAYLIDESNQSAAWNGYVLLPWTLVRKNTVPTFRGASK